ncbi:hypothetical protein BDY24DRAFT_445371 [Mrakia frigida]|uniref:Cox16p n=1 Tax=Mrakia frigida TaxID=29902 RepID=UPI003FCBF123
MSTSLPRAFRTLSRRFKTRFFPANDPRPLSRREPFLAVGLPFMSVMVAASFLLSSFTQLRYTQYDKKTALMSQGDLNKIHAKSKDLASTDVRELYFQLTENARVTDDWDSTPSTIPKPIPKANRRDKGRKFEEDFQQSNKKEVGDWEIKRVERPEGLAEWGEAPKSEEERRRERERKLV